MTPPPHKGRQVHGRLTLLPRGGERQAQGWTAPPPFGRDKALLGSLHLVDNGLQVMSRVLQIPLQNLQKPLSLPVSPLPPPSHCCLPPGMAPSSPPQRCPCLQLCHLVPSRLCSPPALFQPHALPCCRYHLNDHYHLQQRILHRRRLEVSGPMTPRGPQALLR